MNQLPTARDGILPYLHLHNPLIWANADNAQFYEYISIEQIQYFAQLAGLADGCDTELITSLIKKADTILEIGAGYGRVIEQIIKSGFAGNIVAIERSLQFCKFLNEKFTNQTKIIQTDIATFNTDQKFDLILWLWEGIADFSKVEQPTILKSLSSLLTKNGVFVIDTLAPHLQTMNGEKFHYNTTDYRIQVNDWIMNIYRISPQEIYKYAKFIGFNKISVKLYNTSTNRQRVLYILKR